MASIPVFFACDNEYAPLVTTTALSILAHTDSHVDFYLVCPDLSSENKDILTSFFQKQKNATFSVIPIASDKFHFLPTGFHYTAAMYARFFIPLLRPDLSKVIYSDVDVIFCGDIRELYDTDMNGFGLAAPIDEIGAEISGDWNHGVRKKKLNIAPTHRFFQSGNLVINADYWRRHHISQRLLATANEKKADLIAPDMDILNVVFADNYCCLPYRYSLCTNRIGYENNNAEMIAALASPFCIHYAGTGKPWNRRSIPFREKWWQYAELSPYYHFFLQQWRHHTKYRSLKRLFYRMRYKLSWGNARLRYKKMYKKL